MINRRGGIPAWRKWLLLATTMLSAAFAYAQPAPQGGTDIDPPTRVARLSYLNGAVSFSAAGSDEWLQAPLNRPIVAGDRLWADENARAELALDDGTWWLGEQTSIDVSNIDDRIVQVQLRQGSLDVRVRRIPQ